ncbi:uncharacterized protein LOC108674112 [Hyalella azteca]|uniref:Uncharacterized protein LOC108674112 n=1 Tax=Hyalella azteca TaxID=294128 RepID=A0A8B7NUW6_HYAAZ|nr:uncharacterized protein LOC108674112 [Hyalella azteca]
MADLSIFFSKSGITKLVELLFLIVAMATFFSLHVVRPGNTADQDSAYFITAMVVSAFLQTCFLLIVYVFGGMAIQKTLYEFIVNSFYALMLMVAAIVMFTVAKIDAGAIVSGIFTLLATVAYGADIYFSLVNMGALARTDTQGVNAPPMPAGVNSQPFTPPPTYVPPPSLVGPGPYVVPNQDRNNVNSGDLGTTRS